MKWYFLFLMALFLLGTGCDYQKRNEELQKKEEALNQKEQELSLKEKTLQLKEEELLKAKQKLDSSVIADSNHRVDPAITGNWSVKMVCTEATCTGSAVGDTKSEDWNLSYQGNTIIAKAMSGGQLVRTYLGFYTGNTVELLENRDTSASHVKMVVRLRMTDGSHMEGQREIIREDCKVIYDLKLEKNA